MTSSDTTDEIQALEQAVVPEYTVHHSSIASNPVLFARIKAVVDGEETLQAEQRQLLSEIYQSFVRAGAELPEAGRERINAITEQLAGLTTDFGQNVLREQIYNAYTSCGISATDNHQIIQQIVSLRLERAKLLGFETHADFMLDSRMPKEPAAVAALLDQVWHNSGGVAGEDVEAFEQNAMERIGKIRMIDPRYKSSYFQHIFSSDHYAAGYYVYIWAGVLDADGYDAFRENGLFDQKTAASFRENILEKGGTVDPMTLYKLFRGREPDMQPLLESAARSLGPKGIHVA